MKSTSEPQALAYEDPRRLKPSAQRVLSLSRRLCVVTLALLVGGSSWFSASAQLRVRRAPVDLDEGRFEPALSAPGRAVINTSAPIVNLFSRAEDGIARSDWKLAVDSLQRIVESLESNLVAVRESDGAFGDRYEAVQRRAVRRLSTLPREGLAAYRLIYDGRAKGLLDRASASGDAEGLRTVVERFLLTRYGDDAADRLASWLLDAGRAAEALSVLDMVLDLVPDRDVSDAAFWGKVAVANAMLGRHGDARLALERLERGSAGSGAESHHAASIDAFITQNRGRWGSMTRHPGSPASVNAVGTDSFQQRFGPPVEPTIVDPLPWVFSFGGAATNEPDFSTDCHVDDSPPLPPWQAVVDGDRMFVRSEYGVAALRAADLRPLWSTARASDDVIGVGRIPWKDLADELHSWLRPPDDDLFGAIATSHGLVFAIDRHGAGSAAEARRLIRARRFGRMMPGTDAVGGRYFANRLVAYDAETGETVWSRGRSNDARDGLGDAEFRSVPLAYRDELWVPYFRQRDYFVGIFDPQDGSLRREIPLCSVDARAYARRPAQPISFGYGTIYVPSGHGILFAIDAGTHILRWATRYADHPDRKADEVDWFGSQWLASAPIVASGLVLLCPTDHPELLAFSATTGRLRWSVPVAGGSHSIAADNERIWFGGSTISSLSLEDGRKIWSARLNSPLTGRAVRSGDRLFVPTIEGLVVFDALTGEQQALKPLPPSQRPLGNLVCAENALHSVGAFGVRRYPDQAKSYAAALAHFEEARHDASVAHDLAWLELLRSAPGRALSVLESHRAAVGDEATPGDDRLAHVWVEVLLGEASRSTKKPSEALRFYERAGREAGSASDRLRCDLALADQLVRMGRNLEACRALWIVGLSADGEEEVSLSTMVRGSARLVIGERLRTIAAKLGEADRTELRTYVNEELDSTTRRLSVHRQERESLRRLQAVAELTPKSREGQRALFELGQFRLRQRRFAPAEQFFLAALRNGAEPTVTAASLMALCDVYRQSQPGDMTDLTLRLEELRSRFGSGPVPVLYRELDGKVAGSVSDEGETIGDWVASLVGKLPIEGMERSDRGERISAFILSGESAWTLHINDDHIVGRMVEFDTPGPEVLADRLVFLHGDGFASCVSTESGAEFWKTTLRLPESFRDLLPTEWIGTDVSRRAVASGQTAVLAGRDGYFAVGLVSGKRLWAKPYAGDVHAYDPWYADMRMAIGDGVVALLTGPDRLALLRLVDGDTIWEHDLRGESVTFLWILDGVILTADERLERVQLLDRADGHLIRRILFRQPDPDDAPVRLAHTAGVICGSNAKTTTDGILSFDAATGETLWEKTLDKPLVHLFVPREGYIGVGLLSGNMTILDARTGETILERKLPVGRAVEFGILHDGLLVVQHAIAVAAGKRRSPSLMAVDIATGEVVWNRLDLAVAPGVNGALHIIDGVIPAVVTYPGERASRFRAKGLVMIDARTGKNIGAEVKLVSRNSQTRILNDFRILPDRIIVGTEKKYLALHTIPVPEDRGGDD